MSATVNTNCGIGFCSLLTIVFIVLKLTGVISWSWWIVILPVFISSIITILFLIICIMVAYLSE